MRYMLFCIVFIAFVFRGMGQSKSLAENYFEQGEYAKAASIYQKLYQKQKRSITYLEGLVKSLQQQEKLVEAGKALKEFAKRRPDFAGINVKIGHNYQLQNKPKQARAYYQKAMGKLAGHPNRAYRIGREFHRNNLLPEAVTTYKKALAQRPNPRFSIQLAQIYGEQQKLQKMFSTYLDLIKENDKYYYIVHRQFARYIKRDPENRANKILRKTLLKRIQKDPETFYNKMLSWLFVQEDQFKKAFVQEKAIYRRSTHKRLSKIIRLARIASEKEDYQTAEDILRYTVDQAQTAHQKIHAYVELMKVKVNAAAPASYEKINKVFKNLLKEFGKGRNTLKIQLQYADFMAFKQGRLQEAESLLNRALHNNLSRFEKARTKLKLADVLVAEERFNKALIYYSQIQNAVKNTPLAQKATYRIAKTSYYKGDFDWAQTQLKILKKASSDLIANDALALNLLIEENKGKDSTHTALKDFAKADLWAVQGKVHRALSLLDTILTRDKGTDIEDNALYRSAKLYEKIGKYHQAEEAYQKIIKFHKEGVLVDDAYYYLAELYRTKLDDPKKAMANYKAIIFHHADSIFYVDARKKFRKLRGDDIQ